MAPRGRPQKHWCNKCGENFPSGRALGVHMSRHWRKRTDKQPDSMRSAPAVVVDLHLSLLSPCDEKPLLPSLGTQCQLRSEVFSTSKPLRGHMREHCEKKEVTKPEEEATGLMDALATADGDCNLMAFLPVKRKRSKREIPTVTLDDIDAAFTLLLLLEHSRKASAYEGCSQGNKDINNVTPSVSKYVKLSDYDPQLVPSIEFKKPKTDKKSAYEDFYGQYENNNNLILSPKKENNSIPDFFEVELDEFDHGLGGYAELWKPGSNNSVEEMESDDLSPAVSTKRHQCNTCGKSFGSGQALGGHMRLHYTRKCSHRQGVANCPSSGVMKELTGEA